ncbi:MAG: hypothetical protein GY906_32755 [bacterium]|nr:hypothetical protein [bacterium]
MLNSGRFFEASVIRELRVSNPHRYRLLGRQSFDGEVDAERDSLPNAIFRSE